jgi:anti-anti-sigma factor
MGMRLVVTPTEEPPGFRLAGELDVATAPQLSESLEPALRQGGDVTLDLSELSFMDSTGLQVLIRSALSMDGKGRLILRSPGNLVRTILELAIHTDKLPNLVLEEE